MSNKPDIDLSKGDFSFTFDDDVDTQQIQQTADTKVQQLYDHIMILVNNLKSDGDKPVIKWPNRINDLEKFEKQLKTIMEK